MYSSISEYFPTLYKFHPERGNAFIVARRGPELSQIRIPLEGVPLPLISSIRQTIESGTVIEREGMKDYQPVSDNGNIFSVLVAAAEMRKRANLIKLLPARLLVN